MNPGEAPRWDDRIARPAGGLAWSVHPVKRSLSAAVGVTAMVVGVPFFVHASYGDPWLAALAGLILFGSLRAFFLPTRFVLDAEGAEQACFPFRARRPWSAFKSFQAGRGVIRLSPFDGPSRLDATRGMLLRFDGEGEAIRAFVAARLPLVGGAGQWSPPCTGPSGDAPRDGEDAGEERHER